MKLIDKFVEREAAWTISQAYEAFETFLYDLLAAAYLTGIPPDPDKLLRATRKLKSRSLDPSQAHFWSAFVRFVSRNAFETLAILREHAPQLSIVERTNNRALDLKVWHEVVAEVRHAAVHSDMLIKRTRTRGWGLNHLPVLEVGFGTLAEHRGYLVRLSYEKAEEALALFGDYGYAIFKEVSQVAGYPWKSVLPYQSPQPRS